MIGDPTRVIVAAVMAFIGVFLLSVGLEGYWFKRTGWLERTLFVAAGIALMIPGTTAYIGIGVGLLLSLWHYFAARRLSTKVSQEVKSV
jgi:TRAP-type uncharacterized transport system fused permease subunit